MKKFNEFKNSSEKTYTESQVKELIYLTVKEYSPESREWVEKELYPYLMRKIKETS